MVKWRYIRFSVYSVQPYSTINMTLCYIYSQHIVSFFRSRCSHCTFTQAKIVKMQAKSTLPHMFYTYSIPQIMILWTCLLTRPQIRNLLLGMYHQEEADYFCCYHCHGAFNFAVYSINTTTVYSIIKSAYFAVYSIKPVYAIILYSISWSESTQQPTRLASYNVRLCTVQDETFQVLDKV